MVTVVAQDSRGASASIEVTITVTDENEPPSFDSASTARSVAENAPRGTTSESRGRPLTPTRARR